LNTYSWYSQLIKPNWAPPIWLFGPVWTALYVLIAISFGTIFYKTFNGELPFIVALPFALNLIFNFVFVPIQFKLKDNYLATADILLVLGTLIWALIALYIVSLKLHIETGSPSLGWIIYFNIPYLLWITFATILQISITYLNRQKRVTDRNIKP
jgi:translocator protein